MGDAPASLPSRRSTKAGASKMFPALLKGRRAAGITLPLMHPKCSRLLECRRAAGIVLEEFDDQRCDLRWVNMPERMNERCNRRALGRSIDCAARPARFALRRATVEFPKLLDCLLLPGKTRQLILFSTVMKNRTRLR